MKKQFAALVTTSALVALGGCDTTSAIAPYSPSTPNVLAFQSALKPTGTKVSVGDFDSAGGVEIPSCRLVGSLDVTSGKPLQQYVKDALQTELFTAQVYDTTAPVILKGTLIEAKVNTFGTGSWALGLHVSSNKDPSGYDVRVVRDFKTSYVATAACQNATNAFAPTVQDLIGKVVSDPGFVKLTGRG
jgi:hypothetical protein